MTQRLIIMGKNNCPYCDLAKRHLDEHKIPYDYIKIDEDMEAYTEFRESLVFVQSHKLCKGKMMVNSN